MKTLVLYASKYGATKVIAETISKKLGSECEVRNINEGRVNLKNYDGVIIGGSIYMNKIQKKITSFLDSHEKELLTKRLGLFIGCYTTPGTEGYFEQFFSEKLIEKAAAKGMLGGLMQYDKMNYVYKTTFSLLKKIDEFNKGFKEPKIETELIDKFTREFLS